MNGYVWFFVCVTGFSLWGWTGNVWSVVAFISAFAALDFLFDEIRDAIKDAVMEVRKGGLKAAGVRAHDRGALLYSERSRCVFI